ncbi:MAG: Lrp/AsnC family transcriptional regulator [Alphaproteobacteria bacterium]|nr:Lrp/AsnC family transcriptional regulator [Alphaproteobacteria bacterium]
MAAALDAADRRILTLLQVDASLSHARIGEAVGLSVSAVNERVRKLAAAGVLRGWTVALDPAALGLDLLAFMHVLLEKPTDTKPFLAMVEATPEIQECHHVTGEWSLLLKIRVRNTAALERLIGDRIKAVPGVARTLTLIALSSPKETGALPLKGQEG